jgi:hypothetical protein
MFIRTSSIEGTGIRELFENFGEKILYFENEEAAYQLGQGISGLSEIWDVVYRVVTCDF